MFDADEGRPSIDLHREREGQLCQSPVVVEASWWAVGGCLAVAFFAFADSAGSPAGLTDRQERRVQDDERSPGQEAVP